MSFSRIIGQARAVDRVRADLRASRVAETYLFTGTDGAGQRALALELAKALNCEQGGFLGGDGAGFDPCDSCSSCRKIDKAQHPDIFVLDFESQGELLDLKEEERAKQKELRIESVRELIRRSVFSPLEARKKFFVIDGAEHLSEESANALLKALEESAKTAHWVLLASSPERVIPTIRSRARRVGFAPPAAQMAQSHERKGASLATPEEPATDLDLTAQKIFEFFIVKSRQNGAPLEISSAFFADKKKGNARKRAEELLMALCQKIAENLRKQPTAQNAELLTELFQAQDDLRRNVSPQLVVDDLLLSFWTRTQ